MNRYFAHAITGYLTVSSCPGEHLAKLASFGRRDWQRGLEWLDQTGLALRLWDRLKASGAQAPCRPKSPCASNKTWRTMARAWRPWPRSRFHQPRIRGSRDRPCRAQGFCVSSRVYP